MRRDSIFYQLFRQSPTLLFELLPQPPANAQSYIFESIEVKETAFRIDGVFLPPSPAGIVYFCEVQFQLDELLYERMLSEIAIYTYRNRERFANWQGVVIYPTRNTEQSRTDMVWELLESGRIQRVYLDELGEVEDLPPGLGLMVLTTLEGEKATSGARGLIQRAQGSQDIIELVSTIIVYKFSNLSRDEVDAMLGIELEQTRVYQDAAQEGRQQEAQALILRLLNRRVGNVSPAVETSIKALPLLRLEDLGEALLDFSQMGDLMSWLDANQIDRVS
ncbi:Rpn family recombination-promoting nuclease/putative transposase [Chamaesiphon sp. OTE_20_metabat_361]|uniref:Rpn family recombination-promoting nuclease/putative transposase n=1 Tax=Chamaesiphon sp. OTE_20_metabat_361 TaxID=2964689 RepID=UPI00286D0F02|nr:Rpn family recombination-promoting nuclease/putative transposase [Chamaesiphon sp. OTE_20_metabat_361]